MVGINSRKEMGLNLLELHLPKITIKKVTLTHWMQARSNNEISKYIYAI